MIYRVILIIGYYENWFDFDDSESALNFAVWALKHNVPNEDRKNSLSEVTMQIIDPNKTESSGAEE